MRSGFSNKLLVNGVINIVTRSAADTAGTAVAVSAGTFERDQASVGHGGSLGRLAYRVYSQWSDHADSPDGTGASADDRWNSLTTGFRTDWRRGGDAVMAQGGFSTARVRSDWNQFFTPSPAPASLSGDVGEIRSGTIIDRWTHSRPGGSVFQVQAFQTTRSRDESIIWSTESIDDVELQYRTAFGARHDLIVGGGYRDSDLTTRPTSTLVIPSIEQAALNMFVQDEIGVGPRVTVTLGSKVEHNTLAGWGASPSARVMLNVTPTTERAWAAVSRARRTPSAAELGARFYVSAMAGDAGVPLVVAAVGNPELQSEQLTELEAGYRFQVQVDASLYHVGRQSNEGPEAYTRGDARVELTISDRLSAVATGHNLFDPAHAEYAERFFIGSAVVPRRNGELVLEVLTRRPQARLARRSAVGVLAALLLWNAPADAQGVTGPMLKAAFLYNFANFAEWPAAALAPAQPLSLCVIGDNAVAHALEQTIKGRKVDNHELTVAVIKADGQGRSCHLLYISGLGKGQAGRLLQSLKDTSTFTVGDGDQFAAMGGVAQLILENDRMRFAVNVDAAHRARLKISSKLLGLARIVKDQPDVRR